MSDFRILSKVLVEKFHSKLVLYAGCWGGTLLLPFKELGVNSIGCDVNCDSFIQEAKGVLKIGGVIYVETPLPPFEAKWLWSRLRIKRPVEHINLHTKSFWIKKFESHRFRFIDHLEEVLG